MTDNELEQGIDAEVDELTFVTKSGEKFTVDASVANRSNFVSTLRERDPNVTKIDVSQVEPKTMQRVIDWLTHYRNIEPKAPEQPLKSTNMLEVVSDPFDAEFVNLEINELIDLTMAGNFFDIKEMLYLCCAKIASFIKNKPVEDIPKIFADMGVKTPENPIYDNDEKTN